MFGNRLFLLCRNRYGGSVQECLPPHPSPNLLLSLERGTKHSKLISWIKKFGRLHVQSDDAFSACLDNNRNQAYSCPRAWRLSASWGPNWGPCEIPWTVTAYHVDKLKRGPEGSPIMLRVASLSGNGCNFSQSGLTLNFLNILFIIYEHSHGFI